MQFMVFSFYYFIKYLSWAEDAILNIIVSSFNCRTVLAYEFSF